MTLASFALWEDPAPGALGAQAKDIPTITVYPAKPGARQAALTPAMVVLPGGGFNHLAGHEGAGYAEWLSQNGFTSFVVQYRLASDGYNLAVMASDVARAVRWVRARAEAYRIDPASVGLIGSSAGGYLAAYLATHFDGGDPRSADPVERRSSRPDLCVLCYSLMSLDLLDPAGDLIQALLGENAFPEQIAAISPARLVTTETPPCFMMHTAEDTRASVRHSLDFAGALHQRGVPFETHIYEKGRHGIGLANGHPWTVECLRWLNSRFAPG